MSITEIKLTGPGAEPPPDSLQRELLFPTPPGASAPDDLHSVPILLIQLQDELARSRRREALWLSVILHLFVVGFLLFGPKIFPSRHVVLITPADMLNNHELTYLQMPPDAQKAVTPRRSDIISDKNRIAMSRNPSLDRKELQKILDANRAGAPAAPGARAPAAPPSPPAQMAQSGPQQPPGQQTQGDVPPGPAAQSPALAMAPRNAAPSRNVFENPGGSAGSLIDQAARATAPSRGGGGGGTGGDFGLGQRGGGAIQGNMEVLSDTMGVDFGPYLNRVLHDVRENWYMLIPEIARPPLMKKGKVAIEFAIMKNGSVAGLRLIGPSGDSSLDRAAWGGITGSNPFPPLPGEFKGQYLALRFHFFYNPSKNDLQ